MTDSRRLIPAVDALLGSPAFVALIARYGRARVTEAARVATASLRAALKVDEEIEKQALVARIAQDAARWLEAQETPSLRRVINATGVVVHTNLGRAPLPSAATDAMVRVARGYSNLEYDLDSGKRGSRYDHSRALLAELTGAEDSLVVNNAAAALVLAANTVAAGGGVVVSRGELIEIGGGFRIAELLESAGTRLIEVGSTNRTRLSDYRAGLAVPGARALLKVHRSNFRLSGFTEEVGLRALAELASSSGAALVHDLGSGLISRTAAPALGGEPTPAESVAAGVQLVIFSGDKLLGGPQAGLVAGEVAWVRRMRSNPLCRALRVDKVTLAALEATLRLYLDPGPVRGRVPVLTMLWASPDELRRRAAGLAERLAELGVEAEVGPCRGLVGGGACPDAELEGAAVYLAASVPPSVVAKALRQGDPPVIARVERDRLVLDPRTLLPGEAETVAKCLARAVDEAGR